MMAFLLYIARAGLYMSLFYAFYLLVMRRITFFRLNRVMLLAGSYLCLLLPFIRLRSVTATVSAGELMMVPAGAASEESAEAAASSFPYWELLLGLYAVGAAVTLIIFIVSTWKMRRLIQSGEEMEREGCRLVLLDADVPSFSWVRKVVMSRKDLAENPAIFTHERMHVQCRHSLDLIVLIPIQLLFWWNPLVWITREELRLLHEYEADEGVIKNGIDATQYQLLLVRKAVGEQRFSLASGFKHAKLKNRIKMMFKHNSSGWVRWAYLAMIPVLAAFMFACNQTREQQVLEDEVQASEVNVDSTAAALAEAEGEEASADVSYSDVEVKPQFNGGDANEFAKWFYSNIKYPEQAIKDNIQGRMTLQFTIDTDGAVKNVEVLRGIRQDLDEAAVKVVSSSPKWTPGVNAEGKTVPVHFTLPVVFKLQ